MSIPEIYQRFVFGIVHTTWLEYLAVFTGIASVWFSRIENIWVYPVGLVSTIIYTWLSLQAHLPGEASVNVYYTVMSIYGWILWAKRDAAHHHIVVIQHATRKEWLQHFLFFGAFYIAIFSALTWLRTIFSQEIIPWADAFASATAYTGMWLMAKKKVESWYWWIATNIASIPLYFIKGYVSTSVFYFILLMMAGFGWAEWNKRAKLAKQMPAS
ncbi:nicotinamide riboside transporter PnuC [Paraflavitalea soli]|uniref:Nicotinamide riboside transporter PnuC n=1 Tax=Paraflavitalea soli TaxID=2315862 RepID=A0A3B7MTE6_9BACT|nr:nicotinamide riboside transporter PnuC [Paraflavitalea soli]AXY76663.1 nicotinamide riboside transporter PnuC [Paraflavitalea soli]